MQSYTDTQIFTVGILLFFLFLLFFKVWSWLVISPSKRYLKRFKNVKKLKKLEWGAFEHLCRLLFEEEGWKVRENEKKGADGGVDLWMRKHRKEAIVQCKKYEDARVTIKVVREMYGLMYEYDVERTYIVTTSEFTKECYRFVEDKEIELINGETLVIRIAKL
jgi:HJR/Mrr/RecB family endonuclease